MLYNIFNVQMHPII